VSFLVRESGAVGEETKVENLVLDVVKAVQKEMDSNTNSKPRTCMDLVAQSVKNGGGVSGVYKYNIYISDGETLS